MPRSILGSIQQAIQDEQCTIAHLFSFTIDETSYGFSEDDRSYLGFAYARGLRILTPIRTSSRLQADSVKVSLENISLTMSTLLSSAASNIQGQEATIFRLFPQVSQSLLLFRGRISEVTVDEQQATFTVVTEFDPAATPLLLRVYSSLCAWTFSDSNCGYNAADGPLDPLTAVPFSTCPKDFMSCEARGRSHRFSGFIHLTREVTEANS